MGRLDGKVAIVTGAARGTGQIIARLFAKDGAKVIVMDIRDDRGKAWVPELGEQGAYIHGDITSNDDWRRTIEFTQRRYGAPTVLVNNAAVIFRAPLVDTPEEEFDRLYRVNVRGAFQGIKAVAGPMQAAGGGSIVNISSVAGLDGPVTCVAYSASKWALRGLSRVATVELGPLGIRINNIMAGGGNPEMLADNPPELTREDRAVVSRVLGDRNLPAKGNPQDTIASMALYLASDESYHCQGQDFPVDSGRFAGTRPIAKAVATKLSALV